MEMGKTSEIFEVRGHLGYDYLCTYGGLSRFFKEIVENKRLMGAKCPKCGKVWCPPRAHCTPCYVETEWIPLSGKGTVMAASYIYFAQRNTPAAKMIGVPFVLGLIRLDGASEDTWLYSAIVDKEMILNRIKSGTRVRVEFREKREGKVTDFYFVPEED